MEDYDRRTFTSYQNMVLKDTLQQDVAMTWTYAKNNQNLVGIDEARDRSIILQGIYYDGADHLEIWVCHPALLEETFDYCRTATASYFRDSIDPLWTVDCQNTSENERDCSLHLDLNETLAFGENPEEYMDGYQLQGTLDATKHEHFEAEHTICCDECGE